MQNLSVIIPAAHPGYRMKSYGPKSLLGLDGETIIGRQLRLLHSVFPTAEFVIVVGFEQEKIKDYLTELEYNIKIVTNHNYHYNNVASSLMYGLEVINSESALIISDDIIFSEVAVEPLNNSILSIAIVDSSNNFPKEQVGVTVVQGNITIFSHGLKTKWTDIVLLQKDELYLMRDILRNKNLSRWFTFELLNKVLTIGGKLIAVEPNTISVKKINNSKDLLLIRNAL